MSETLTEPTMDQETLKQMFDEAMKLFERIENASEPLNSDSVQMNIRNAISKFEKCTNLVSLSGMFSKNERVEELPTETLQYLLLPMLLGALTLKITSKQRRDLVDAAEIYFRDFLQRCKDYGITDVEIPQPANAEEGHDQSSSRPKTETQRITVMVQTREAKMQRFKELKDLKSKLENLKKAMESPSVDEHDKRQYFLTMLLSHIHQSLDELDSLQHEKPILQYMTNHANEPKSKERPRPPPLKPVIITRDAIQKQVYGLGYPSIPTLSIEEFYDKRVREGTFPAAASNIPHKTIETAGENAGDDEDVRKEKLEEEEDPEELERQRNMDEYKDEHRRGWGNRHNRS